MARCTHVHFRGPDGHWRRARRSSATARRGSPTICGAAHPLIRSSERGVAIVPIIRTKERFCARPARAALRVRLGRRRGRYLQKARDGLHTYVSATVAIRAELTERGRPHWFLGRTTERSAKVGPTQPDPLGTSWRRPEKWAVCRRQAPQARSRHWPRQSPGFFAWYPSHRPLDGSQAVGGGL